MEKDLERQKGIFGTLIYENKGRYEKSKVKGHRLHVKMKMKENN